MTDQPSHIIRSTDEELDQLFANPPAAAGRPSSLAVELAEHLRATSLPARPEWDSTPHLAHGEHQYDGACAICRTADRHALPVVVQAVLDRLAEVGRDNATVTEMGGDAAVYRLADHLWRLEQTTRMRMRDVEDKHRAEVESLRATVRGLTSQTQAYVDRAAAEGARIVELTMERDAARSQVAELSESRAEAAGRLLAARGARDAARAELDRLRGLLRDIAIARRGDCPDVDRDHEDLPDEIRSDHAYARRQAEKIERLRAAIPGDIDPVHVRPMLRLLGPARMVLDQLAEALGGQAGPWRDEAADMAQRIVDWIGHPTTDEPAWATLPCEHGDACRTCRHCLARVRAGYRPGLVDGAPVIDEQRETGST